MMKLAPILEEVSEDISMSSHEGSGGYDRKLHQAIPLRVEDGIGPESITRKSAMAKYNTRVIICVMVSMTSFRGGSWAARVCCCSSHWCHRATSSRTKPRARAR